MPPASWCDVETVSPRRTPLEQKLGTFIRMLASERDGEVVAAARAIVRTLKAAGADIHVLAERVETANGSTMPSRKTRTSSATTPASSGV